MFCYASTNIKLASGLMQQGLSAYITCSVDVNTMWLERDETGVTDGDGLMVVLVFLVLRDHFVSLYGKFSAFIYCWFGIETKAVQTKNECRSIFLLRVTHAILVSGSMSND